jgi:chromosome segregation ATPase
MEVGIVIILAAVIAAAAFIIIYQKKFIELQEREKQLKKEQEDLAHAQDVFRKEQEAKADLSKKTEKEIAIDLYVKFIELEGTFKKFQEGLDSIDDKTVGIKNYSEDLNKMQKDFSALNAKYSSGLQSIYDDMKESLEDIDCQIENSVERALSSEMASLSNRLEDVVTSNMPDSLDRYDVESAVESALRSQDYEIKSAVESAVSSALSSLELQLSFIQSKLDSM